ncbi:hypothetical protein Plhal304r1_c024g0082681 [Plasmopara halstedii]
MKLYQCVLATALVLLKVEPAYMRTRYLSTEERSNFERAVESARAFVKIHPKSTDDILLVKENKIEQLKTTMDKLQKLQEQHHGIMVHPNLWASRIVYKVKQWMMNNLEKKILKLWYERECLLLETRRIYSQRDVLHTPSSAYSKIERARHLDVEMEAFKNNYNLDKKRLKALFNYKMENITLKRQLDVLRAELKKAANEQDLRQLSLSQAFDALKFDTSHFLEAVTKNRIKAILTSPEYRALFEHAELISSQASKVSHVDTLFEATDAATSMEEMLKIKFPDEFIDQKWQKDSAVSSIYLATLTNPKLKSQQISSQNRLPLEMR